MVDLPDALRAALLTETAGVPRKHLVSATQRLIGQYRSGSAPSAPILASATDAAAYAAYRMPATYAAVRSVLGQVASAAPDFAPRTQLDVGGGTGAALWAAADTFPALSGLTVVEQSAPALSLGRRLAATAPWPAVRSATWLAGTLAQHAALPSADLVTAAYLLTELGEAEQRGLITRMAAAGTVVVVVEPGTPAGFQRVAAARRQLTEAGLHVLAPCPHGNACPLVGVAGEPDWCHFATRVNRSAEHRQLKEATLGHEDEKFSYLVAARFPGRPGAGRVLRHPVQRKGQVLLRVCGPDETVAPTLVTKRHGPVYQQARKIRWGDAWPAER